MLDRAMGPPPSLPSLQRRPGRRISARSGNLSPVIGYRCGDVVDRRSHKQEYGMTQDQIAVVQQSFAKVVAIADRAAIVFYNRLFEVAPQFKAMFPADMAEQRQKLMATLSAVVYGLSNLESVLPAASALAKRHVAYGTKPEHYPVVGSALLWTLERGLGDAWTREVADAWTAAYGTLSGYMIEQAYGGPQAAK